MQILKASLLVTIAPLALSACTTTPVSQDEIDAATQAQVPSSPGRWTTQVTANDMQVNWIKSFNDPTLIKLVQEAQVNNKNLQASAASVERARALAVQAGAALMPAVDLAAGGNRSGSPSSSVSTSNLNLGLQLSWELDVWGRIRAGAQGAAASAQAIFADYRYAQHSLAAATIKAYLVAIEATLQTNVARERLTALEETLRITEVRYKNGLASAQDLALTRSDLATAREQLATVESSQRDAVRALEILLGRYPSAELAVRASLPDVPPAPPAGIPSELLERRPDLVAAERRVAAAFNAVAQAKAAQLPRLSLTSSIGGASNSLSNILTSENVIWQLGTNLLAPIFDGGRLRAQVEVATAEQKQSLAAYAQAALTAFSEVETSLDQGVVLHTRETELQEAMEQASKAYRIAKLRYKEGETDLLDVLTIQQRVIGAKSNLTSVRRFLLEQRVNLNLALGGSWTN